MTDRSWKSALYQCLSGIDSAGEFAASTTYHRFPNPGLRIGAATAIPLPLTAHDAEAIKELCTQAPFGKGDQTLVDVNVRKTWELDASVLETANPEWALFRDELVRDAARELGLTDLTVKPHKLLLYEEGSFFKRHKDSEKEAGMIGTLVICLPSPHEGGDVSLSFGGQKHIFATAPYSAFDLTVLSWFSDVSHEVHRITNGYRLVLTYKLIQSGHSEQSAMVYHQQVQRLRAILAVGQANLMSAEKLIYPLEHMYTKTSLSLNNMKGRDRAVCQSLQRACAEEGFLLLLAHMTRSEDEDSGGYYDKEQSTSLTTIFSCDGKVVAEGVDVEDHELLGGSIYDERAPDSEDEGEFTGNESAPSSFRYHDTVALLVPMRHFHKFMASNSYGWTKQPTALNMTKLVIDQLLEHRENASTRSALVESLKQALSVCQLPPEMACTVRKMALDMNEKTLYREATKRCNLQTLAQASKVVARHIENISPDPETVDWGRWLGVVLDSCTLAIFQSMSEMIKNHLQSESLVVSLNAWNCAKLEAKLDCQSPMGIQEIGFFKAMFRSHRDDSTYITTKLLPALASRGTRELLYRVLNIVSEDPHQKDFPDPQTLFPYILNNAGPKIGLTSADLQYNYGPKSINTNVRKEFALLLDYGLSFRADDGVGRVLDDTHKTLAAAKRPESNSASIGAPTYAGSRGPNAAGTWHLDQVFDLLKSLLSSLGKHDARRIPSLANLVELLLQELPRDKIGPYPTKLPGWRHKPRGCMNKNCVDCAGLNSFLHSQEDKNWRFAAAQGRRRHIEGQLPRNLFMTDTDKSHSPHTLIVRKLGNEFAQDVSAFDQQIKALEQRMLPLKGDFMRDLLGEDKYDDLILLKSLSRPPSIARVAGVKRPADDVIDLT